MLTVSISPTGAFKFIDGLYPGQTMLKLSEPRRNRYRVHHTELIGESYLVFLALKEDTDCPYDRGMLCGQHGLVSLHVLHKDGKIISPPTPRLGHGKLTTTEYFSGFFELPEESNRLVNQYHRQIIRSAVKDKEIYYYELPDSLGVVGTLIHQIPL